MSNRKLTIEKCSIAVYFLLSIFLPDFPFLYPSWVFGKPAIISCSPLSDSLGLHQFHGELRRPFLFENLVVYQKAVAFSIEVSKLTDYFPRGNYYLTDQFNRAALSIPANLAEGNGRWHPKDRCQFFWIARGSALECIPIIEVVYQKGLIASDVYNRFRSDLDEIGKMITGLIKGIKEQP